MGEKAQVKSGTRYQVPGIRKKAQVTLFVILAMVILVAGILIYQFLPGIKSTFTGAEQNPKAYIQACLEDTIQENINTIMLSGGELNPDHPYQYQSEMIDYACYTPEFYEMCILESPMLIRKVELEIKNSLTSKINSCFDALVEDYENRGYQVDLKKGDIEVRLSENKFQLTINNSLSVSKEESQRYENFVIQSKRSIYEVLLIGYNILNWEATFGDAYVDIYMDVYPNFRVQKIKRGDGTKIYVISERNSGDTFRFATRSLVVEA